MFANIFAYILVKQVCKILFRVILYASLILSFAGCAIISKPIGMATKAVLVPVQAVAGVTAELVAKPIRKTAQIAKPITPVVRIR